MTDAVNSSEPRPSALEIEDRAADFLMGRRDYANWSDDDQAELETWLSASIRHQVAYFRLEAAVGRAERLRALKPTTIHSRNPWPNVLKVAAGLSLVVVIAIAVGMYVREPRTSAYQTAIGDRETLSLSDGSQIELNTDSSVRLAQGANGRQAWLEKGEAYFQIKHDTRHPFVVLTNEGRITDLGTKFVVRRFPDRLEVTLLEGSARVDASGSVSAARSAVLKSGDVATVRAGTVTVNARPHQLMVDELGWRRGILTFRYATLAEAAEQFNRYNRTKIVIPESGVAKLTIYGAFAANDAAAFADAAQIDFKLQVESRDGKIILTR